MGRFASTVAYYAAYREPYPPEFFAAIATRLGLDGRQRLLDIGCGPALLALGLAPYVNGIVGVDPEPEMLAAARRAAAAAGVAITLIEGRIEEQPLPSGPFALATIGRALHWLDPERTRAKLGEIMTPDGVVLICGTKHPEDAAENAWLPAYSRYRTAFGDGRDRHVDLEKFFACTRFRPGPPVAVRFSHRLTLAGLAGRTLSKSTSSRDVMGADADRLEEKLAEMLAPWMRNGELEEVIEARAVPCASTPDAARES